MSPLFNHYASKIDLTLLQYEAVCALANTLFEDAASTAKHKTKRVIRNVLPAFDGLFDEIAKDNENKPILTERGNTQTVIEYLEHNVRNTLFHDGITNIKFEPGAARVAYGELGMQAHEDTRKLTLLKKMLQEISIAHETEYDSNLNGMTFDELKERFGASIQKADSETEKRLKTKTYDKSDYIIEWIPDFKTAQQYRQYTDYGNPNECWCLTRDKRMWDDYTGLHNENKVYFCHVPNFESVPRETGPNAPLDDYGLSLISVIVMPDKHLRAVTCRWNHINGGSDGVMDQEQLSDLLGGYVFDICPPYSKEEAIKRGYIYLEDVQQMLDDGIDLSKYILDDGRIKINEKMNVLHGRKLLCDQWFDSIDKFVNGFARVDLNEKRNFINTEGKLLSDNWFDGEYDFDNGLAIVTLNGKVNVIDTEGNIRLTQWVDRIDKFVNGFAHVILKGNHNFIDTEGNILSDQWFGWPSNFINGLAIVTLNGKVNVINKYGKMLSAHGFDYASNCGNGFVRVKLKGKHNFINIEGKLLSDEWFDDAEDFVNGLAKVTYDYNINFINTEGNILSDRGFDAASNFVYGFARVVVHGKYNFIDPTGNILSDQWFDKANDFMDGFAHVTLNGNHNFIDTEGKLLSDQWFWNAADFCNGFAKVYMNEKYNFIDTEGNILSDQWFDGAYDFTDTGYARVFLNRKSYYIDTKGNPIP